MEEFVIGLAPKVTNFSIGQWFQNMMYFPDHQAVATFPTVIKVAAGVLMTLSFETWKRGLGKGLHSHCEANSN